jgi:tetratricopeptide (TPR) repeat protein
MPLCNEATLAARLTAAADRNRQQALALLFLAKARRAIGDSQGTITAYQDAIKVALPIDDRHILAVANDNLGNVLADVGQFDEALSCYDQAMNYEVEPKGRWAILTNQSNALLTLGEQHSAARKAQEAVAEIERAGIGGRELAIALDNSAIPLTKLGEPGAALKILERARTLFDPGDLISQATNALNRSETYRALGDKGGTARAFCEAHKIALEYVRNLVDPEHFRQGFIASRSVCLPTNHPANRLFQEGLFARDRDERQQAIGYLEQAQDLARKAGDLALSLRVGANIAALMFNWGDLKRAGEIASQVHHEAAEHGLARPDLMAIGTIGSLAVRGVDIGFPLRSLGAFVMSAVLLEVHARVVTDAGLDSKEAVLETYDPGTVDNELANMANARYAYDLAVRYFREAIKKARYVQGWFELVNRLSGLLSVLACCGTLEETDTVANEITSLLAKGTLSERGKLVARRALGFHLADRDRSAAINHLRLASALAESLRHRVQPGPERADVASQYSDLYRLLARLLLETGDDTASFEALQGEKGRRLTDALAALVGRGAAISDALPTAHEVLASLNRLNGDNPTMLVDLAVEKDRLTAYLVGHGTVRSVCVAGDPAILDTANGGDSDERQACVVKLCLRERLLGELAEAVTAAVPKQSRLLLVPDRVLHNLPLHATPVNGRPWCEHFPIGFLAAAGELRFAPVRRMWIGRSLVVGDSRSDLPNAAEECREVAAALGSKPLVGPECTRAAIEKELQAGEFDIVHLALHGRGDARRGGRASLLLGDGRGGTEWVAFDELAALQWRAELVVFSGCSTAVAGPRLGHELVGVARAAAERGAASVVACLWPVGDEATKIFMMAFFRELIARRIEGSVDLRIVLDVARKSLCTWLRQTSAAGAPRRDGRSVRPKLIESMEKSEVDSVVADALAWAPFILLGDPILGN